MKRLFLLLCLLVSQAQAHTPLTLTVRVQLIHLLSGKAPHFFRVESKKSLEVNGQKHTEPVFVTLSEKKVFVCCGKSHEKKTHDKVTITSSCELLLNGTPYSGLLTFSYDGTKPLCVSTVPVNDYLYSVLRYEGYVNWPLEMLKTQAVTSRTYAVHHLMKNRGRQRDYDILSTNLNQNYKGTHEHSSLRKAIDGTAGEVLIAGGKPIDAMFDICCGGIIPANSGPGAMASEKYLKRETACTACAKSKQFSWTRTIQVPRLLEVLGQMLSYKDKINNLGRCKDIEIDFHDAAGLAGGITIVGFKGRISVSGKDFSSIFSGLPSKCYTLRVEKKSGTAMTLHVDGKGNGHLLGLCQEGAAQMARDGKNYQDILTFYYPGTKFATMDVHTS